MVCKSQAVAGDNMLNFPHGKNLYNSMHDGHWILECSVTVLDMKLYSFWKTSMQRHIFVGMRRAAGQCLAMRNCDDVAARRYSNDVLQATSTAHLPQAIGDLFPQPFLQ